jgi:hypothetical protein
MKKITSIFVALMLVAVTAVTAFAAGINSNEQAVLDELNATISMQGSTMKIPAEFVNQAESYFNTIEMTADESSQIIAVIKEGESFLSNSGAANIADLSAEQKQELLSYGQKAVAVIGMTMTYDNTSKTLYIYDASGATAFAATPTLTAVSGSTSGSGSASNSGSSSNTNNSGVIKTTGATTNFAGFAAVGAVAVVLVAGCAIYFVKTKKEA